MDNELYNTAADSIPYYNTLYKYNGILDNQHNRRSNLLSELKTRRNNQVDELRGISDIFQEDSSDKDELVDIVEHHKREYKNYGHKFMLSEWLNEVPEDLEEEWVFKLCPIGCRSLIVANHGITKAYNRHNKLKAVFQSNIPGGSPNQHKLNSFTLLDCIYRSQEKTYYVLDVLVWNSVSLLKCSTEFRFFFLKSKLLEKSDENIFPIKFLNIDYERASLAIIENCFMNEQELPIDGILFYHKDCAYTFGLTPLVGWLKPYMIPEKLIMPVHSSYMAKKPKNYTTLEDYLDNVQKKYKKHEANIKEESDIELDLCEDGTDMSVFN